MGNFTCFPYLRLLCLGFIFGYLPMLQAQDTVSVLYKTNPLRPICGQVPFTGEYSLSFEKKVDKRFSYQGTFSVVSESLFLNVEELTASTGGARIGVIGARLKPALRFYFVGSQSFPEGLYWGPMLSVNYVHFFNRSVDGDHLDALYSNINALIGYQFKIIGRLYLDIFGGLGYKLNTWSIGFQHGSVFMLPQDEQGVKLTLGFEIGLANR